VARIWPKIKKISIKFKKFCRQHGKIRTGIPP